MSNEYQVELHAIFIYKASSVDVVKGKIKRAMTKEGLPVENLDLLIYRNTERNKNYLVKSDPLGLAPSDKGLPEPPQEVKLRKAVKVGVRTNRAQDLTRGKGARYNKTRRGRKGKCK